MKPLEVSRQAVSELAADVPKEDLEAKEEGQKKKKKSKKNKKKKTKKTMSEIDDDSESVDTNNFEEQHNNFMDSE